MKKIFVLVIFFTVVAACKNETKEIEEKTSGKTLKQDANATYKTFKGEFIYVADGAVLKGNNFIHGVTIDEKMQELVALVKPIQKNEFDMVPVVLKGELVANPLFVETGEGWRLNLTIKEIVKVGDAPAKADLKIKENKK